MLEVLIPMLVAGAVAAVVVPVGKFLLNADTWLGNTDDLPTWAKRLAVGALAAAGTWLTMHSPVSVGENPLLMDSMTLSSLLSWAMSMGLHWLLKKLNVEK